MKLQNFIAKHPKQLPLVSDISRFYPLSTDMLERYRDKLNWNALLMNPQILWEFDFLEQQFQLLHPKPNIYRVFSSIDNDVSHLPWSEQLYLLLVPPQGKIDFLHFSQNPHILWSAELIDKYCEYWHWDYLSMNPSIPFTQELLNQFTEQWDWYLLSTNEGLTNDIALIEAFKDKWDFFELSSNPRILEKVELIAHYQKELSWRDVSSFSPIFENIENFSFFQHLIKPQSFIHNSYIRSINKTYLYETLTSKMDGKDFDSEWSTFWAFANIRELLKIAPDLIEDFHIQVKFNSLSSNLYLPLEMSFFEKYQDNWHWEKLSSLHFTNPFTRIESGWPMEYIERFSGHWDWGRLANNNFIQWELPVVLKYFDRIPNYHPDFGYKPQQYILKHPNLPISEELLDVWDRYFDDLYWDDDLDYLSGATRLLAPDEVEQILSHST